MKSYKAHTPYSCLWMTQALNPSPPSIQALACSKKTWEVNQEPNCHPQSFINGKGFFSFLLVTLQPLCMNLVAASFFANLETCKIDKGYSQTKPPCVRDSPFRGYNPSLMVTFVISSVEQTAVREILIGSWKSIFPSLGEKTMRSRDSLLSGFRQQI